MPAVLLAESGSTKTDWCLVRKKGTPVFYKTSGINPYLQTADTITELLSKELLWREKDARPEALYFYGAGAGATRTQQELKTILQTHFGIDSIEVQGDMMAAARSLSHGKKGVICILGTGSNSCYFDGHVIRERQASLGYLAGDEGSGNHLGKRVLQYYAYKTFDEELMAVFEAMYGNDVTAILQKLYREPFPNRFLAGMVGLLAESRGHYMVENILEDCFSDFFQHQVLKYRESWTSPLHFTGSVAYAFRDVLTNLCDQYELELGSVTQSPMEGLIAYHKTLL